MIKLKIVLLFISLLLIRCTWYYLQSVKPSFSGGQVTSEPKVSGNQQRFNIEGSPAVAFSGPLVHMGDIVQLNNGKITIKNHGPLLFYWQTASFIRAKIANTYQNVLPKSDADLLTGIVLGSASLDSNFKNKLARVGLTHVVAASGMNVTFVFGMVMWFLNRFSLRRYIKIIIALSLIIFYATLTGFDPPIVRATLMAGFVLTATFFGRQSNGWTGLFISAYIMLWVSPNLISNAGFLLSFTSMMGQIFLSTVKVEAPILIASVIEVFLQSLVAILFTLPIVLIFFSNFSLISLFTNVLALWTIEPLMVLGSLIASLGILFTPFAQALSLPAQVLLEYFLWVVDFFSKVNFFRISFSFSSSLTAVLFAMGYYFLLTSMLKYLHRNLAKRDSKS